MQAAGMDYDGDGGPFAVCGGSSIRESVGLGDGGDQDGGPSWWGEEPCSLAKRAPASSSAVHGDVGIAGGPGIAQRCQSRGKCGYLDGARVPSLEKMRRKPSAQVEMATGATGKDDLYRRLRVRLLHLAR